MNTIASHNQMHIGDRKLCGNCTIFLISGGVFKVSCSDCCLNVATGDQTAAEHKAFAHDRFRRTNGYCNHH